MLNPDNKTKVVEIFNLNNYKKLIENNPCHIATVSLNFKPNLSVASDIKILNENTILISNNEMINTPNNILSNENIVLTSFSDSWAGLRLTGKAKYYTDGEYFNICNQLFNNETATPKGAIVVTITKIESIA